MMFTFLRRITYSAVFLALLAIPFFPGDTFYFSVHAAELPEDTVRILIELHDTRRGDVVLQREARDALRQLRRITSRAPHTYTVDGNARRAADLRRWRVLEVARDQSGEVVTRLQKNPAVADAHIEQLYEAAVVPNDVRFSEQWGLSSTSLADIKAPLAWEKTSGSSTTVMAVIDAGVDLGHEDLRGKVWVNGDEVPANGVDDDGNGFVDDSNGWDFVENRPVVAMHDHGTHVAGIAAAHSNNTVGVAGVDWQARIMSVRVLNQFGVGGEEGIIRGINYAVAEGADIINLSFVGRPSQALLAAVENAYASGVVVVAAAGNSGASTDAATVYPVCAERAGISMVLGVAALDEKGEPASFSNYGKCVDIAAPGKRIVSTATGNRYKSMSGTSMSSPFAAGAAGLYLALHPGAAPAEVIAAVSAGDSFTGERAARWNERYKKRLNAARVVGVPEEQLPPPPPAVSPSPSEVPSLTPPGDSVLTLQTTAPTQVRPGGVLTYTFSVANTGSGAAQEVFLEGDFDRDLTLVGESSSSGCTVDGREARCPKGTLVPGETATFTLSFIVAVDVRCSETFRASAKVYSLEEGRSRVQVRGERARTDVACPS